MRELTATPSPPRSRSPASVTERPLGPNAVLAKLRQATN
jgi:hypothetical protein